MNTGYRLIEPAVLMEAAGHSLEAFRELLDVFLRVVPDMAQRIDAAVAVASHAEVARETHALKSCLRLVGASDCAARTEQMERAATGGGAGIDATAWQALRRDLALTVAEARACRNACATD